MEPLPLTTLVSKQTPELQKERKRVLSAITKRSAPRSKNPALLRRGKNMGSTYQLWQPILIVYTDDSRSQACAHPLQDRLRRCRGARLHHPNFQLTSEPKPTTRNHRLNREFTKTKHSPRPRHSTHPLHDIEFTPSSENSVRMEAPDMKLITPTLVSRASNLLALISRNSHHLATLSPEFGVSWVTTNDSWISDKKVFAMLKAIISFWPRV